MNEIQICTVFVFISAAVAAAVVLWNRHSTRKIMESMDVMIDAAMNGNFTESYFDESLLSSVETKLAHYLAASEVSGRKLQEERDKINELIGDISHQTRTPLANILLYSQLIGEQTLPQAAEEQVALVTAQAEKLHFLIASLVKISRLETGVFSIHEEYTAVEKLINSAVEQVRPAAREKGIELYCGSTDAFAVFDLKWTSEALYNILDNAVKYTPAGGKVSVCAESYELFCRITVGDTGKGIAEEELSSIFARFYRSPTVAEEQGVGIGLYLARQIISAEGGYIKVESEPGKGSAFSVFLKTGPV